MFSNLTQLLKKIAKCPPEACLNLNTSNISIYRTCLESAHTVIVYLYILSFVGCLTWNCVTFKTSTSTDIINSDHPYNTYKFITETFKKKTYWPDGQFFALLKLMTQWHHQAGTIDCIRIGGFPHW